jgi:NitT/TauT family transport system substrate-binding protein
MLEGFLKRDEIVVCSVPHGSRFRFDLLMQGEIEATTMTEPYVTLAEKKGCRVICTAFYHGTQVGTDTIEAETMSAYNRAVTEAVRRIKADKRKYLQYFIDYHKERDPEIGMLTVDDLRESRLVVVEPAPIPADELRRTYEWVKSWGMLETTQTPAELVNIDVQARVHAAV